MPNKRSWHILALQLLIAAVAIGGLAALFYLKSYYRLPDNAFGLEVSKTLLQAIGVLCLGAVVSLLTAEYTRSRADAESERARLHQNAQRALEQQRADLRDAEAARERLEANRNEFRKESILRLNKAYAATKRARRLLRATACIPPDYKVPAPSARVMRDIYDAHLQALNDTQLDLEVLVKDLQSNTSAFHKLGQLTGFIASMEESLNSVISEYESERNTFDGDPPTRQLTQLPFLHALLGPGKGGAFEKEFVIPYQMALGIMRSELLGDASQDAIEPSRPEALERSAAQAISEAHRTPK